MQTSWLYRPHIIERARREGTSVEYAAERTFLHETGGHFGSDALFGGAQARVSHLDRLFNGNRRAILAEMGVGRDTMPRTRESRVNLAEEWLMPRIEAATTPEGWKRLTNADRGLLRPVWQGVRRILRRAGLVRKYNEYELNALAHAMYAGVRSGRGGTAKAGSAGPVTAKNAENAKGAGEAGARYSASRTPLEYVTYTAGERDAKQERSIIAKVARYFGYTTDPREAGYVLPNGRMLDLSGKRNGDQGGMRNMDHRDLPNLNMGDHGFKNEDDMLRVKNAGVARVDFKYGTVNITRELTAEQQSVIVAGMEKTGPDSIVVEVDDPSTHETVYSSDMDGDDLKTLRRAMNEAHAVMRGERAPERVRFSTSRRDGEDWKHRRFLEGEPVARLTGNEFPNDGKSLISRVLHFFSEAHKGFAENEELGPVILDRRGIRDSWNHNRGTVKAVAFAAVPDVIEKGRIIERIENYEGRNYERVLIAAPVSIEGKHYTAVVAVNRKASSNRFFFHEIVLTEKIRESALSASVPADSSARPGAPHESIPSVLRRIFSVKGPESEPGRMSVGPRLSPEARARIAGDIAGGKDTPGRPDLANPGETEDVRRAVRNVDAGRETGSRTRAEVQAEGNKLDREAVRERMLSGAALTDEETLRGAELLNEAGRAAVASGDWAAAVDLVDGWRRGGTEQARALALRRDMTQTPAERLEQAITLGMAAPGRRIGKRLDVLDRKRKAQQEQLDGAPDAPNADKWRQRLVELELDRQKLIERHALEMQKLTEELARQGLELQALLDRMKGLKPEDLTLGNPVVSDAVKTIRAIQDRNNGAWSDALYEYWVAGLLSGPKMFYRGTGDNFTVCDQYSTRDRMFWSTDNVEATNSEEREGANASSIMPAYLSAYGTRLRARLARADDEGHYSDVMMPTIRAMGSLVGRSPLRSYFLNSAWPSMYSTLAPPGMWL